MAKESFVLVSLKEDKARKLAKVLHNESCRKILDYLTSKESTETELAKKLNIPISTVHYNLKHLLDAGLITAEEFHYSQKGREVNHYKLANKYIIIAPKSTFGIKERLKSVLPAVLLVGASAFAIQIFRMSTATFGAAKTAVMEEASRDAVAATAPPAVQAVSQANPVWWFLAGALVTIIIFLVLDWIKSRR
jgi:DNA-binding transcriptional ArsR family regulator